MNASEIYEFSINEPAVFIVGMERGGTSIVYQTLSTSPVFGYRAGYLETFVFDDPTNIMRDNAGQMAIDYLGGEDEFARYKEWFKGITNWPDDWSEVKRVVVSYFYYASKVVGGGVSTIEKTPRHVFAIDFILECFPKAKIIACIRNPFGVIESYKSRLKREISLGYPESSYAWLQISADDLCGYLDHICIVLVEAKRKFRESILIVNYDEMLRDPELTFGLISDFTGAQGFELRVSDERGEVRSDSVDPLLDAGVIYKGNTFKSSLSVKKRIALVRKYPGLFAVVSAVYI